MVTPARQAPVPTAADGRAPVAVVEEVLAGLPEISAQRLGEASWGVVLSGEVRHAIPVSVELGSSACTLRSYLLRGPRPGPATAALHTVLLRKNRGTVWVKLCLDADDDVVIVARIPLAALSPVTLGEALGEILVIGETAFEALVHLGYPGVFPPLQRRPG